MIFHKMYVDKTFASVFVTKKATLSKRAGFGVCIASAARCPIPLNVLFNVLMAHRILEHIESLDQKKVLENHRRQKSNGQMKNGLTQMLFGQSTSGSSIPLVLW